ncbi:unnamed protein product, partial [Ilex paraguariensis]
MNINPSISGSLTAILNIAIPCIKKLGSTVCFLPPVWRPQQHHVEIGSNFGKPNNTVLVNEGSLHEENLDNSIKITEEGNHSGKDNCTSHTSVQSLQVNDDMQGLDPPVIDAAQVKDENVEKSKEVALDDERGLTCSREPPDKGFQTDDELSTTLACIDVDSQSSDTSENYVAAMQPKDFVYSGVVTRSKT